MKPDYTHVSMLLDRSGSMESIKGDVIGGFNRFLSEQKAVPGEMTLTLAQFDDVYEVVYQTVDVNQVRDLTSETFQPRSSTALLDSVAKLINDTGKALAALPEHDRPSKVLVVIITDGQENASREQTRASVAAMIRRQQDQYKWQFIYIGANQDSFAEAGSIGVKGVNMAYNSAGVRSAFTNLSLSNVRYRTSLDADFDMSQEDIDKTTEP